MPRKRYIDIVCAVDASESMAAVLGECKAQIRRLHTTVREVLEQLDKTYTPQLRIRVIAFRDCKHDGDTAIRCSEFFAMPDQYNELCAFLNRTHPKGGAEGRTNALEALALAMDSVWMDTGYRSKYAVVLLTSTPPTPLADPERLHTPGYPPRMPTDFDALCNLWQGYYNSIALMPTSGTRLILCVPQDAVWDSFSQWDNMRRFPFTAEKQDLSLLFYWIVQTILTGKST